MNNKLNIMLRQWADNKSIDDKHLLKLSTEINEKITNNNYIITETIVTPKVLLFHKLSYAGLGAIAAIFIMLLSLNIRDKAVTSPLGAISLDQVVASKKLFEGMKELFPQNLHWVAESSEGVTLGIKTPPSDMPDSSEPMHIIISVVSRQNNSKNWQPVWNANIIFRGGKLAEILPTHDSANKVDLWVYTLNDGKLAVDTNIKLDIPVRFAVKNSTIMEPGIAAELITLREENIEYKVFQTITPLENNA